MEITTTGDLAADATTADLAAADATTIADLAAADATTIADLAADVTTIVDIASDATTIVDLAADDTTTTLDLADDATTTVDLAGDSTTTIIDPLSNPYSSLNSLCHDLNSLQDLACRGSWRTIIDKVARARSLSLLTKPHEHLVYLTFNLVALAKLRRFTEAHVELQSHLDDNDLLNSKEYFYESYPNHYPNQIGSMVPFALRWLHAHLPSTVGNRQQSLDRFYSLLEFVRQKGLNLEGVSKDVWRKREVYIVNTIINYHLSVKEFKICVYLLKGLVKEGHDEAENAVILSKLGYVQMQCGDLDGAKKMFEEVEKLVSEIDDLGLKNLVGRNRALMYIVGTDYISAVREYEECIERDGFDAVAINNKAVCLMYLRDLSDSIKVLENALERVPTVALNETLVVNLCSMYELAYVNHADIKKTLSNWIARVAPDDFDSACTRI